MNMSNQQYQYLPVRLSHLLTHCSVGAVVRGPDYLMIVQDISKWTALDGTQPREIIFVEQIKATLNIQQTLREPPIAKLDKHDMPVGTCIPASRFPSWMACDSCGLMHTKPWIEQKTDKPICQGVVNGRACKKPLTQVSLVLVHSEGHINDLDWHYLAHKDAKHPTQKQCGREPLTLKLSNRRTITCIKCKANARVTPGTKLPYLGWSQPWMGYAPELPIEDLGEVMEVNDTRIHRVVTTSALVIPPESRIGRHSIVAQLYCDQQLRDTLNLKGSAFQKRSREKRVAEKLNCDVPQLKDAVIQIENGFPNIDVSMTTLKLLEAEYQAILEPIIDLKEDEDFVTHHVSDQWHDFLQQRNNTLSKKLNSLITDVVEIRKLKEIMVFKGFTRGGTMDDEEPTVVPPAIDKEMDWLPALELYGEGIFINFDNDIITQWEKNAAVIARTEVFKSRFARANIRFDPDIIITPRFMFLHALSHLLIKELEIQAGYPSASLKERIYASIDDENSMAGILIYVAIPDVDGTLGGLAELTKPERLEKIIIKAFEKARWCSLDPVCASHDGQGVGLLNKAACHACELLPETSCFCGNILLDRIFIKGDANSAMPSVLDMIML
ncbi:DrmB family protein [Psychrobacter celer]|uniref:DrmB family protein n=1 Tax=Psychrobacter celer TaxID=306572 RepID=UPI003FD685BE